MKRSRDVGMLIARVMAWYGRLRRLKWVYILYPSRIKKDKSRELMAGLDGVFGVRGKSVGIVDNCAVWRWHVRHVQRKPTGCANFM